jgi:hypothetical protein
MTVNKQRALAFAGKFVEATLVENVQDYKAFGSVTNLSNEPMLIGGDVPGIVPPWKSTIIKGGTITRAERIVVVNIPDDTNLGGVVLDGWDWFGNRYDRFPRTNPLYISPYDIVGEVELNPYKFANMSTDSTFVDRYDIRLNLWWGPAKTDALLHNEHDFLEIHTQIFGFGRIQIYRECDLATQYREITVAPGETHDPIVRVIGDRDFRYPWHRGWTDTDAIWMAIELHPKK